MSTSIDQTGAPGPWAPVSTREGPLAHVTRVASEEAYLAGLTEAHNDAWQRASGARPERSSKRLLVALSHAIEKAVMSGPTESPTVVVALFQKLEYFDRERDVYARMAAAGLVVVVGFVREEAHETPPGVHVVLLSNDEPLADEWTVVAMGPRAGAFLVATDQHRFDPHERDFEASRQFAGRWGFSRVQAGTELARLRFALGERLAPELRRTIDALLAAAMPAGGDPAASAGTPGETWATTSLFHVIDSMQDARAGNKVLREQLADAQNAAAARAAATVDPNSGLTNPDFLQRWSRPGGTSTLPIGLALFAIAELGSDTLIGDPRASYHAAHQAAAALTQPIGPVDAVVRLSAREFLVVVPGASVRHLAGICDQIGDQLELASHGYPDISLRATVVMMVTSSRPLPVGDLHEALARLDPDDAGPIDAGTTPAGDRIGVASTRLHDRPVGPPSAAAPAGRAPSGAAPAATPPLADAPDGTDVVPLPRRTAQMALAELVEGSDPGSRENVFAEPAGTWSDPRVERFGGAGQNRPV